MTRTEFWSAVIVVVALAFLLILLGGCLMEIRRRLEAQRKRHLAEKEIQEIFKRWKDNLHESK